MSSGLRKPRERRSLDHVLRTLLAGGMAGCVAKTTVAPLDRVKILFQASNPDYQKYSGNWTGVFQAASVIRKQDGIRGLFQGHSATLLRIFPYAAIKFMAYDQIHDYLMPSRESETNLRRFAAGAISGTISVLFTYPLELIRVRLAFETRSVEARHRPTLSRTIRTIYREGLTDISPSTSTISATSSSPSPSPATVNSPTKSVSRVFDKLPILKFYRGFSVTIIGMVPYAGTSFLVWGYLRSLYLAPPRPDPNVPNASKPPARPGADLIIGAISGATAQTVSYPFEVVRRRMQVGGLVRPSQWVGFGETVRDVWGKSGWRGFFVGLSIGYLKVVPMTAVSFTCWEGGKRLLGI